MKCNPTVELFSRNIYIYLKTDSPYIFLIKKKFCSFPKSMTLFPILLLYSPPFKKISLKPSLEFFKTQK